MGVPGRQYPRGGRRGDAAATLLLGLPRRQGVGFAGIGFESVILLALCGGATALLFTML